MIKPDVRPSGQQSYSVKKKKGSEKEESQSEEEEEEEREEIGECELAMCCVAGLVLLLTASIVAVAVSPAHKPKVYPKTQFKSNVKTVSTLEIKGFTSSFVKDALLSEKVLRSRVVDCTSFAEETKRPDALDLLVLVHSPPDSTTGNRNKVRMSWKKSVPAGVEVVFVVPAKGKSKENLDKLRKECNNYKDMVLFHDGPLLPESESMLLQLAWASQEHINFHYLLKTRDYMYVHLPRMMTDLIQELKHKKSNAYLGYFRGDTKARNKLSKKAAESYYFLCDKFIRYAHSSGYLLSRELVRRLHSMATYLYPYNNEDVAMATWLSPYQDVDWRHDIRFNTEINYNRGCRNDWLIVQSTDLVVQHQRLQNSGKICPQEWEGARTYLYNFDMPPSNCCTTVHFH